MKVYGKQLIINYDGSNLSLVNQGFLSQGKICKARDNFHSTMQIMKSLVKNTIRTVLGRNKSGHEYLFSAFIQTILKNKEMPYDPEEGYDATITFLEVLQKI